MVQHPYLNIIFSSFIFLIFISCTGQQSASKNIAHNNSSASTTENKAKPPETDTLRLYLDPILAKSFDYPVGKPDINGSYISKINGKYYSGWYVAVGTGESYELGIHTGEDWNGKGGGNTDFGQSVYATAKGIVLEAKSHVPPWGNIIMIEHRFLENARLKKVYSLYAHLDTFFVSPGDTVMRRQIIGRIGNAENSFPAHLHFEIRKSNMKEYPSDFWPSSYGKTREWVLAHYEKPSEFIKEHQNLTSPYYEKQILIAMKRRYKMYRICEGQIIKTYEIALSQSPYGHKERQGDNRMPEGEYRIIQKLKGPIGGPWGEYFGSAWIRLNYPNNTDAINGYTKGLISASEMNKIISANDKGQWPPKNTALGGGIGIHGWIEDWIGYSNRHLTWGCISMRNQELSRFYDLIETGDKILILP